MYKDIKRISDTEVTEIAGFINYKKQLEDMNAIKNVFTKEDIDRIVAETREIQRKAEKYDLLIEKLKEMRIALNKDDFVGYADEITDVLAEVEEE